MSFNDWAFWFLGLPVGIVIWVLLFALGMSLIAAAVNGNLKEHVVALVLSFWK